MLVFKVDFTNNLGALLPIDRDLKFYYVKGILQNSSGIYGYGYMGMGVWVYGYGYMGTGMSIF